jgi:hypothetical protein
LDDLDRRVELPIWTTDPGLPEERFEVVLLMNRLAGLFRLRHHEFVFDQFLWMIEQILWHFDHQLYRFHDRLGWLPT